MWTKMELPKELTHLQDSLELPLIWIFILRRTHRTLNSYTDSLNINIQDKYYPFLILLLLSLLNSYKTVYTKIPNPTHKTHHFKTSPLEVIFKWTKPNLSEKKYLLFDSFNINPFVCIVYTKKKNHYIKPSNSSKQHKTPINLTLSIIIFILILLSDVHGIVLC